MYLNYSHNMPKHLKKISEETLHENSWWTYKHDVFEKPDGTQGDYFYGETNGTVMVVPVNKKDNQIVLTLQHRYLTDKQSIEFPAGGIKKEQQTLEAAKAELYEETGWVADEWIKVGEYNSMNGIVKDVAHVFIAYVTEQHDQQLDDTEDIEVMYRRPDEVDDMIRKNEIWDGQTMAAWALVHHYFLH